MVDGKKTDVVSLDGVPIGPTWQGEFFLGADTNGRDTAVRLLYGGRNSLLIGVVGGADHDAARRSSSGILAGYFRGFTDTVISRTHGRDLGVPGDPARRRARHRADAVGAAASGRSRSSGKSKLIPILIIAVVYVPYMARPIRGQVLSLREKEFVEAARAQGAGLAADHGLRDPPEPRRRP